MLLAWASRLQQVPVAAIVESVLAGEDPAQPGEGRRQSARAAAPRLAGIRYLGV